MTDEKFPQQADGKGHRQGDDTGAGHDAPGESGGGAYPNPHRGKKAKTDGPLGHGGQTDIDHYGGNELGGKKVDSDGD